MNYQLTLVSPVHIGTGNMITPFDYVASEGKFVLFALDKLLCQSPQRAGDFAKHVVQWHQGIAEPKHGDCYNSQCQSEFAVRPFHRFLPIIVWRCHVRRLLVKPGP